MIENLNIKDEIINKRGGSHFIKKEEQKLLNKLLDNLHVEGLFDKYNMTYTYTVHEDYIVLILYRQLDLMR